MDDRFNEGMSCITHFVALHGILRILHQRGIGNPIRAKTSWVGGKNENLMSIYSAGSLAFAVAL